MIHIATIHWRTDKWIDLQLNYFMKNIKDDYKVYAFLNDISSDHSEKFHYCCMEPIPEHYIKLNLLAEIAMLNSNNQDDWLIFIDGDAFPIGDIVSFAKDKLVEYPLIAIQRRENYLGGTLPHPSFCLTTLKFWKDIKGNWGRGFLGKFLGRPLFEVGGILQTKLQEKEIDWYPMLRSNKKNLHPLMFGIYEDLIYHHGAGFRLPTSRLDIHNLNIFARLYLNLYGKMPNRIRKILNPNEIFFKNNIMLSEKVYSSMLINPEFYNFFCEDNEQEFPH